jgi:diguanylate cyclase (GGDEF)-like protein
MKQEPLTTNALFSARNKAPLNIVVYGKDPLSQRLIQAYLRQQTAREITSRVTDQMSQVMVAAERGEIDLILADIDNSDDSKYWLGKILENQLVPVIVLTENELESQITGIIKDNTVNWMCKVNFSREELLQTIDSIMLRWQAIRRNLAHREELERLANYDQLTGLLNRRAILGRLEECIARSRRYREELSILLLDIDHFEEAGEALGNVTADAVLARVAANIRNKVRDVDLIGRYGRDEFLVILPYTHLVSAELVAERIRKLVEMLEIDTGQENVYKITVSGGLAYYWPGDDVATFTYRAEDSLSKAKYNGRNCIAK